MKVSIITPCFNDGIFLEDAYRSLRLSDYPNIFEHIIVDDGSTDPFTIEKLKDLEGRGVTVVHQKNSGLAIARNTAIKHAKGEYILPLDSDNKIEPKIFIEALSLMEADPTIDVVYTDAMRFGETNKKWVIGPFNTSRLFTFNYIDACALIRKSSLMEIGGYDSQMPVRGHEDWELWVNFYKHGRKFHYLPKIGYYYRIRGNSMIRTLSGHEENRDYIFDKHHELLPEIRKTLTSELIMLQHQLKKQRLRSIIKILTGKSLH